MFVLCVCSIISNSLQPHGLKLARLLWPWDFPGNNTGVGCRFLLQGIFPTQGSNPLPSPALAGGFCTTGPPGKPVCTVKWSKVAQSCLTLCDPVDCSLPGSSVHGIFQAIVLEWVAISFSRGSSQPRAWTRVSRIVGRCFTIWATRKFVL